MKQVVIAIVIMVLAVSLASIGTYAHFSDTETVYDNYLETSSLDLQLADYDEDFGESGDSVSQTWYYATLYPPGMDTGDSLDSQVYLRNIGDIGGANHLYIYCHIVNVEIGNDTDAEHDAENAKVGGRDDDDDGLVDEDPLDGVDNDGDGMVDEDLKYGDNVPLAPGYGIFDKDKVMIINYMKYHNATVTDLVWADGTAWDDEYMSDVDGDGKITLYDFKKNPVRDLLPPVSGLSSFSMKVTLGTVHAELNEYQGDETRMTLIFNLLQ